MNSDTNPTLLPRIQIDSGGNTVVRNGALILAAGSTTVSAGELAMTKITASGTAPGATRAKMDWVAGTNAGSCKLISYAGTSATATTIVDNVGGGC